MSTVHGNLSHAMRDNYNEHGVDEYYRKVAATYRNPFFPGIKKVIWTLMNRWWEAEGRNLYSSGGTRSCGLRVLDMAAGSGEATLCLLEWATAGSQSNSISVAHPHITNTSSAPDPLAALRAIQSGQSSRPAFIPPNVWRSGPASAGPTISSRTRKGKHVFGNMDPPQLPENFEIDIVATDPYTSPAYRERTSRPCHPISFTDLANGVLPPDSLQHSQAGPIWDVIVCSFALHLVTSPSELFALLYELSGKSRWLVIIAPHKKPEIKETWGWSRWDIASWTAAGEGKLYASGKANEEEEEETELEIVRDKVKLRLYRSNAF